MPCCWEFHQALGFTFQKAAGMGTGSLLSLKCMREASSSKSICLEFNCAKIFSNSGYFSEFPWKLIYFFFCFCGRQRFLLRNPAMGSATRYAVGLPAVSFRATSNTRG